MAEELDVPFLGNLPLDPVIARCCDEGQNPIEECSQSAVILNLNLIVSSEIFISFIIIN